MGVNFPGWVDHRGLLGARASDLHLLDVRVPLPHSLHVSHQFLIKAVKMLLQNDFQLEHLPDVRERLTQDLVPVGLKDIGQDQLKFFPRAPTLTRTI